MYWDPWRAKRQRHALCGHEDLEDSKAWRKSAGVDWPWLPRGWGGVGSVSRGWRSTPETTRELGVTPPTPPGPTKCIPDFSVRRSQHDFTDLLWFSPRAATSTLMWAGTKGKEPRHSHAWVPWRGGPVWTHFSLDCYQSAWGSRAQSAGGLFQASMSSPVKWGQ